MQHIRVNLGSAWDVHDVLSVGLVKVCSATDAREVYAHEMKLVLFERWPVCWLINLQMELCTYLNFEHTLCAALRITTSACSSHSLSLPAHVLSLILGSDMVWRCCCNANSNTWWFELDSQPVISPPQALAVRPAYV